MVISQCTKQAIVIVVALNLDIVALCTTCPLDTSSQRSFFNPRRFNSTRGNANALYKLMSAQAHGQRIGRPVLSSVAWVNNYNQTRILLQPHCTPPLLSSPLKAAVFSPSLWNGGNSWWGGPTTFTKHSRSLLHASLTLFSLANFSFLLAAAPPPKKKNPTCTYTQFIQLHPSLFYASPFWWWFWHAVCHAAILWEVAINRAVAIWSEISRQNPT